MTTGEPVKLKIDLVIGKPTEITQPLKEQQKMGVVMIDVKGSWGYVYWKGKNLGENKGDNNKPIGFRLPVGRQQLRIANPASHKSKTLTIDVAEKSQTFTTTLD